MTDRVLKTFRQVLGLVSCSLFLRVSVFDSFNGL